MFKLNRSIDTNLNKFARRCYPYDDDDEYEDIVLISPSVLTFRSEDGLYYNIDGDTTLHLEIVNSKSNRYVCKLKRTDFDSNTYIRLEHLDNHWYIYDTLDSKHLVQTILFQ